MDDRHPRGHRPSSNGSGSPGDSFERPARFRPLIHEPDIVDSADSCVEAVARKPLARCQPSTKADSLTICKEFFRNSSVVSNSRRDYNGVRMLTYIVRIALMLSLLPIVATGRSKSKEPAPKDAIDVAGRISVTGGPVTRLVTTQHYSRTYLYAEHASTNTITKIDVTDRSHPTIVSSLAGTGALLSATGDAALVSSIEPVTSAVSTARTISILDFSDKASPSQIYLKFSDQPN
jgi:hypothetical protein